MSSTVFCRMGGGVSRRNTGQHSLGLFRFCSPRLATLLKNQIPPFPPFIIYNATHTHTHTHTSHITYTSHITHHTSHITHTHTHSTHITHHTHSLTQHISHTSHITHTHSPRSARLRVCMTTPGHGVGAIAKLRTADQPAAAAAAASGGRACLLPVPDRTALLHAQPTEKRHRRLGNR